MRDRKLSLAGLSILLLTTSLSAQPPGLKEKLLADYNAGSKRLVDFYSRVRIDADRDMKVRIFDPKSERFLRSTDVYRANGALMSLETTITASSPGYRRPSTFVVALSPWGTFKLSKMQNQPQFSVYGVKADPEEAVARVRADGCFAVAPFTLCYGQTLAEFLADRYTSILATDELVENELHLTNVRYRVQRPVRKVDYEGWVKLSPANSWAIVEHGRIDLPERWDRTKVSYELLQEAIPLVKEVRIEGRDDTGESVDVWTITKLEPQNIPDDDFVPSFYGLDDKVIGRVASRLQLWWIWGSALVLLAIVAMAIRISTRRTARKGGDQAVR